MDRKITIFMKENAPWLICGGSLVLAVLLYVTCTRYQATGGSYVRIYDRWTGTVVYPKPRPSADEFLDGKKGDIFDEVARETNKFVPPSPDQIER